MRQAKFNAVILKSPKVGGWTYVIWPESVEYFKTKGLVRVIALVNGVKVQTSFMAIGNSIHKLPLKKSLLQEIDKNVGDEVEIKIIERLK